MRLRTKFILITVGLVMLVFCVGQYFNYRNLNKHFRGSIKEDAENIHYFLNSLEDYLDFKFTESNLPINDNTFPFLTANLVTNLSKLFTEKTGGITFNHVSTDPRNLDNKADVYEEKVIKMFQENPDEKEYFGEFSHLGKDYFIFATPYIVEERCLKCHGKKENAPEFIQEKYDRSYGYKVGDLRGIASIKIPKDPLKKITMANLISFIIIGVSQVVGICVILPIVFGKFVNKPVNKLMNGINEIAKGNMDYRIDVRSKDEMGQISGAFNVMTDEVKRSNEEVGLRERYLTVLTEISIEFLKGRSMDACIQKVLQYVGETASVSHVYIFENRMDAMGKALTSVTYEWVSGGIEPFIDNAHLHHVDYEKVGFRRWMTSLSEGDVICGRTCDFPESEKYILLRQNIKSILVVPIFVEEKWWGFIGLDMCHKDHDWKMTEISLLRIVASFIASIIKKERAEEALMAEKERLAVTLRSICDGVITTDSEGKIVLINTVAETLTGWTQTEALGKPLLQVFNIIDEKTRERCKSPAAKIIKSGKAFVFGNHRVLVAKDGIERLIADSGAPLWNKEGKIIGAVLVFNDITEKRRFEEDILKAQKLESLGILAGGIAHDFNNILTAILGNTSIAKEYTLNEDKIFKALIRIEKASIRAQELTQQLLTFSKGGVPVKKTASVVELIKDSIDFALKGSNVKCEFTTSEDIWPIEADEGQMNQVINNLIINANQAMAEGGIIEVRAENIMISERDPLPLKSGRYVKISFADQGVGITKEHLQKIFDPYFTTKQRGSGLGLATTYSIIKKHDGHVTVESEVGIGTTFYIYLPASKKEIVANNDFEEGCIMGKGKVLIMDDEEIVRDVTGQMLAHLGYDTIFAKDGAEAIELYKNSMESEAPFDAIVMDLTIPGGMGGKETIKKLFEINPKVKAIVSSGYSNDPIMSDFKKYGFSGIFAKPYKINEVSRVLYNVIMESD